MFFGTYIEVMKIPLKTVDVGTLFRTEGFCQPAEEPFKTDIVQRLEPAIQKPHPLDWLRSPGYLDKNFGMLAQISTDSFL